MATIVLTSDTGAQVVVSTPTSTQFVISGAYQGKPGVQGVPGPGVPNGGTVGQILAKTANNDQLTGWIDQTPSDRIEHLVTQNSHGFTLGQVIRLTPGGYFLSQSNTRANAQVLGIVSKVIDSSHFVVCLQGYLSFFQGLTPGIIYFLSDTQAGQLTTIEPTNPTSYSYPLFIAETATTGYFFKERAIRVGL